MNIPLSNEQIDKALTIDNSYIVKYSELDNFTTLSELFGTKQFIILLIESEHNSGHWVVFYRVETNHYIYFNSFGNKYDTDLSLIGRLSNKILGNEYNSIRKLIGLNDKIEWNRIKYQSVKSSVCGRYCIFVVRQLRQNNTLKEIQTYLKENKKAFKSYDELILHETKDV